MWKGGMKKSFDFDSNPDHVMLELGSGRRFRRVAGSWPPETM